MAPAVLKARNKIKWLDGMRILHVYTFNTEYKLVSVEIRQGKGLF